MFLTDESQLGLNEGISLHTGTAKKWDWDLTIILFYFMII